MSPTQWGVTAAGLVLLLAVNLHFLGRRRSTATASLEGKSHTMRIRVRGAYDPDRIEARVGRPLRLIFHREEVEGCSDTVLIPHWKIARRLPAHVDTLIELAPTDPGEYEFTCGMGMLRGTIVMR
ncbi:MAG TPA: cupredoxin domain-containing protein [Candidatus Eisenbacteria bacterium]